MRWFSRALVVILCVTLSAVVFAQTPPSRQNPKTNQKPDVPADQDVETLKIDTNLVTVPVIASSRTGTYIADLRKEEFSLTEDGVPQQIAFLASVNAPFHVALLLDTSASTGEKLPQIQRAATAFLDQLGPNDKVKIISFDSELHDLSDFTSDREVLRQAIAQTHTADNTRVYDAVQLALDSLRLIDGRKAIVIFTDGVDWHSETSTYDSTMHDLDESGVIVYPIRFDTRAETERIARNQDASMNGVNLPTSTIIRRPPSGTTPTTFPGDEPFPVPQQKQPSVMLPDPRVIFGRQSPLPPPNSPNDPFPNPPSTTSRRSRDPRSPDPRPIDPSGKDSVSLLLDNLYSTADRYLKEIGERTGGQLYRADTLANLPQAFAAIAVELRTQYLLGYYPTNKNNDGAYRKIQVKTLRKDVAVRARPGYRAKRAA